MAWPPEDHADVENSIIVPVGSSASPLTDAGTTRPTGASVVYWMMANGVTPTNAQDGDLIWNADA